MIEHDRGHPFVNPWKSSKPCRKPWTETLDQETLDSHLYPGGCGDLIILEPQALFSRYFPGENVSSGFSCKTLYNTSCAATPIRLLPPDEGWI
jgi:hypothetical protein